MVGKNVSEYWLTITIAGKFSNKIKVGSQPSSRRQARVRVSFPGMKEGTVADLRLTGFRDLDLWTYTKGVTLDLSRLGIPLSSPIRPKQEIADQPFALAEFKGDIERFSTALNR